MSSSYLVEQLAEIRSQVAELKRGRTTHRAAQVLTSDATTGTFTALLPNGEQLSGVSSPLQFLPAPGEQILLRLDGATPIYEPAGIAEDAITGREIAPGAIDTTQLAFDISQYTGGTRIFYGADTPVSDAAGDLWLKELSPGPPPKYETRRWDGQAWTLLQDQGVTEALAKAVSAEEQAISAGLGAIAASNKADDASGQALTAQQAAEAAANAAAGKTTTFRQDAQPATTGRTVGDEWIETDQGNRRHIWTGTAWTLTQIGAGGISATARQLGAITTFKQIDAPATAINGDFWIRSTDNRVHVRVNGAWEESKDADINAALTNAATAQATADGKVRIFVQADAPLNMTAGDVGDLWIDTDDSNVSYTWSGTAWVKRQIGNGAIEPKSLIARDVVATGTVSAALLEAILVLATIVIAGNPDGRHARLGGDGLKVFRPGPDGQPEQAGQFGGDSATGDFVSGGRGADGQPLWAIDETGVPSFQGANITGDPSILGRDFTDWINAASGSGNGNNLNPGARHYIGWADGSINSIGPGGEVGIVEMVVEVDSRRSYKIGFDLSLHAGPATAADIRIRDGGTGAPTFSSPSVMTRRVWSEPAFEDTSQQRFGVWNPTTSGIHRLLLTVFRGKGDGFIDVRTLNSLPAIWLEDMGPRKPISASVNRGGFNGQGGTIAPPATKQYFQELTPAGKESYRGDGTLRTDLGGREIVQGYSPNAPQNGNGKGYYWFNLPNITGTVDRVEVYMYASHWHYNSGGTVRLSLTDHAGGGGPNFPYLRGIANYGGFTKPGSRTMLTPSDWWPFFRNVGATWGTGVTSRAYGVTVGPGDGTNPLYYGRITDCRLRIWWTQ